MHMNNNQTVEKLKQMRLTAMAELHLQHVKNKKLPTYPWWSTLACGWPEWEDRGNQEKTRVALKQARLSPKSLCGG